MTRNIEDLQFLHYNPESSRAKIAEGILNPPNEAALKRLISAEFDKKNIEVIGKGPSTRYRLSP